MMKQTTARFIQKSIRAAAKNRIKPVTGKNGKKFYPIWLRDFPRGSFAVSMSHQTTEYEAFYNSLLSKVLSTGKIGNFSGMRMINV